MKGLTRRTALGASLLSLSLLALPALGQQQGQNSAQSQQQRSQNQQGEAQRQTSWSGTTAQMTGQATMSEIRDVQQKLKDNAQYQGQVDGVLGPKTIAALDAALGVQSQGMQQQSMQQGQSGQQATQMTAQKQSIERIQQKLKDEGRYAGQVDGIFGRQTANGVLAALNQVGEAARSQQPSQQRSPQSGQQR